MFPDAMIKYVTKTTQDLFWLTAQEYSLSWWKGVETGARDS